MNPKWSACFKLMEATTTTTKIYIYITSHRCGWQLHQKIGIECKLGTPHCTRNGPISARWRRVARGGFLGSQFCTLVLRSQSFCGLALPLAVVFSCGFNSSSNHSALVSVPAAALIDPQSKEWGWFARAGLFFRLAFLFRTRCHSPEYK